MSTQRQPAGAPASQGGQFASTARATVDVPLTQPSTPASETAARWQAGDKAVVVDYGFDSFHQRRYIAAVGEVEVVRVTPTQAVLSNGRRLSLETSRPHGGTGLGKVFHADDPRALRTLRRWAAHGAAKTATESFSKWEKSQGVTDAERAVADLQAWIDLRKQPEQGKV